MTEHYGHKKSYIENLFDRVGKVGDALPAAATYAEKWIPSIAKELHVTDGIFGFFLGPLSAIYDAANPENDPLIRAISLIQIPASLAAKYETVHGILAHSAAGTASEAAVVAEAQATGAAAEVGIVAEAGAATGSVLTLGSFLAVGGVVAAVIGEFKFVYGITRSVDEHTGFTDWAIGYTHPKGMDPEDYPKTTIYHYLESNLPMPEGVREKVEQGLKDQGATWPQFGEYPLYIQHELNEHAMNGLESMINSVRGAMEEIESWVFIDPDAGASGGTHASGPAEQDHRVAPQAGAGSESVDGHDRSSLDRHTQGPDGGDVPTRGPIGYIEVLTANGPELVPYYDAPQGAEADPDPSSPPEPAPAPTNAPHTVPYGPPAPARPTDTSTGGAFAPAADELGVDPGAFAPAADELGVDPGAFAPAADELGVDPGAFAPAADELGVDPGAFAPAADELGVDPGAFAPAADELGVDPGAFAPAADELGVDPGAFAPAADELGVDPGAFAPAADELGVDPGAFAPAADELGVDPGAFAPAADELGVDPGAFAPAADAEIPPDEVPY